MQPVGKFIVIEQILRRAEGEIVCTNDKHVLLSSEAQSRLVDKADLSTMAI